MAAKIFALFAGVALFASLAIAESNDCTNPSIIVPDGRVNLGVFAAPPPGKTYLTYWYGFYGQAGHSYSVEFVSPADNDRILDSKTIFFNGFMIWGPSDHLSSCNGKSSVSFVNTSAFSPVLMHDPGYGDGERFAFIASASGLYVLTISNSGGAGSYSFRVVDTTLFNARWSTWSGWDTQWGFVNLSDMTITGAFVVYDSTGNQVSQVTINLNPGGQPGSYIMRGSHVTDLNLKRNTNGYATFAYIGPPQAMYCDSYTSNSSGSVIIPARFETRNAQ